MSKQILSCDWGTSTFRLRLIKLSDGSVQAETNDDKGIAVIYNEWLQLGLPEIERAGYYKRYLLVQIEKFKKYSLTGVPVIISGMASSSIGIIDIPYGTVPFLIGEARLNVYKICPEEKYPFEIFIISGLKTTDDVMRGEETILTGCDIENIYGQQLFIFPGTHSKHVVVQNCIAKDFKTYMTGEIFDLLTRQSILSKSAEQNDDLLRSDDLFVRGVHEATNSNLLNSIFHIRTRHLFGEVTKSENYHYLSGLLIGEELKSIDLTNFESVTLVSTGLLSSRYSTALSELGFGDKLRQQDSINTFIEGQIRIYAHYH